MPENNNNDQPLDFAEKVLQSLKRQSRAVDLTASSVSRDFTAYGAQEAGDPGPGSGGNKDIVIIPGFGGAAASSTSQVNFYWNAPAVPDSTGIDNNVRATIYNYAISATRPTLVIGGYDGTNQYKPIANYGTGTGITAKIWFHPFLGRIDADQFGFNTLASTGVSTVTGVLTWDTTQNRIRVGVAGTAKTIAYTEDISPFSGAATTASNLNLATSAAATNHFITMSASQTATGVAGAAISTVSTVFVVPSTGVVNASGFSGNVTGTVSGNQTGNMTGTVSGNVTGNVSGNVTGGVSGNVTGNVTGTVSGNVTGNVSGNLTGNVSGNVTGGVSGNVTGNVTGTVSGNVTGNVSGNLTGNVSGNVTGNVTGIATTASGVTQLLATTASENFVTFSPFGTSLVGAGVSVASSFKFVPSSGVVIATGFSGNVTGTVSGNVTGNVSGNVTGNVSGNVTGGVSGNVTGNVTGTVSGNVTGNVSGNLTGGVSGNVTGNVTGTVSGNVTGNVSGSVTGNVQGNLTGNVSGNVTGNVSGNLTGNVSGTATTAQHIHLASTLATTNYILLSSLATGPGIAISTDTNLAYNASTDTLTVPTIVGSGAGLTLTSTTAISNSSYLTIQTNSGDDNTTSDFFIRGINSTAVSKFSVDGNGNLRATTKSFDIPHPTKEGKRLVYGVLEGPEHGVYHRGTVEGKGNILIELPEYWTQLVNDSYSIQLTPWGNYGVQILEKTPNSFIISATGNLLTKKFKLIKVDYIVHGSRKDAHLDIEQD